MSSRVVVVDDSSTIVALVSAALARDGYEIATADTGERALDVIREQSPALVIVDANLPGLSGYDVCRSLRADAEGPQPHVIMLTASTRESDRVQALEVGANEFMEKPFSPGALRERVREILGT